MDSNYCRNCKRNTETVTDYDVGDIICSECGWIIESSVYIDEGEARDRDEDWKIIFAEDKGRDRGDQSSVDATVSLSIYDGAGSSDESLTSSLRELNMEDTATSSHNAGDDIVVRVCSKLGMNSEAITVVQEAVSRSKELRIDEGNSRPVLAAIVYMIGQISDHQKSLRDISLAAEVGEEAIKKSYKDLYPFTSRIIPNWHANEEKRCRLHLANLEIAPSQHYSKHHLSNHME